MGDRSAIEWTDASWNAVTGCTEVSRGCDNCYARTLAHGKLREVYGKKLPVVDTQQNREDTFAVRLWPDRLDQPGRWRKPRMIFVNSMSDFFHADIPEAFQVNMLREMLLHDRHTYQVLTKRPGRAIRFFRRQSSWFNETLPPHIWIGTSVEDRAALFRVGQLKQVPASVRFVSFEPLLEAVGELDLSGIHWAIVGGESGPGHRPIEASWVREIRDQCHEQDVAFFFKQWGGRTSKAGGRLLDGREWSEFPTPTTDVDP